MHTVCVEAMDSLLGLLSTNHFIRCVETLLEGSSDEVSTPSCPKEFN